MAKTAYSLVGMQHRGTVDLVASLPAGELLTLIREPLNLYDRNAVQVWARSTHVGYVRATEAKELARRMDISGHARLSGKFASSGGRWPTIEIDE